MPNLAPKRVKFRKMFKGQRPGVAARGHKLDFGEYGLMSLGRGWMTSRQIESARKTLTHFTAKGGRVWIRVFPDKPISKKPLEVKLGGGKGDVYEYVCVVKPGRVLFEMGGLPQIQAVEAIRRAGHKLPFATKFISKDEKL